MLRLGNTEFLCSDSVQISSRIVFVVLRNCPRTRRDTLVGVSSHGFRSNMMYTEPTEVFKLETVACCRRAGDPGVKKVKKEAGGESVKGLFNCLVGLVGRPERSEGRFRPGTVK